MNFDEKFMEIIANNDDIEDIIEVNEIFLAENLGVRSDELSRLTKILSERKLLPKMDVISCQAKIQSTSQKYRK